MFKLTWTKWRRHEEKLRNPCFHVSWSLNLGIVECEEVGVSFNTRLLHKSRLGNIMCVTQSKDKMLEPQHLIILKLSYVHQVLRYASRNFVFHVT